MISRETLDLFAVIVCDACTDEPREKFALGELAKRYGISFAKQSDFAESLKEDDRFFVENGPEEIVQSRIVNITDKGRKWVEEEVGGDNIPTYLDRYGVSYSATREEAQGSLRPDDINVSTSIDAAELSADRVPASIESSRWTGIEVRLQSRPDLVNEIKSKIREIDGLVEKTGLKNAEKEAAKRITESLILLVESPDPEWKAIVQLLKSPTLAAILSTAQVVQFILSLILGS